MLLLGIACIVLYCMPRNNFFSFRKLKVSDRWLDSGSLKSREGFSPQWCPLPLLILSYLSSSRCQQYRSEVYFNADHQTICIWSSPSSILSFLIRVWSPDRPPCDQQMPFLVLQISQMLSAGGDLDFTDPIIISLVTTSKKSYWKKNTLNNYVWGLFLVHGIPVLRIRGWTPRQKIPTLMLSKWLVEAWTALEG